VATVVILQQEEISQSQTVQQCAGTAVKYHTASSYKNLYSYGVPKCLFKGYLMEQKQAVIHFLAGKITS